MATQAERLSTLEAQNEERIRARDACRSEILGYFASIHTDLTDIKTCLKGNGAQGLTTRVALLEEEAKDQKWLRRTKIGAWISVGVACTSYVVPRMVEVIGAAFGG